MKLLVFLLVTIMITSCNEKESYSDWRIYRGNNEGNSYSSLNQINTHNVKQLKVAWEFHTGDSGEAIECNPIVIDSVMYLTSPGLKAIAINASTGKLIWEFDPFKNGVTGTGDVNRGVAFWSGSSKGDKREDRILFTAGSYLFAINAKSGDLIREFGKDGKVDLREGLGRNPNDIFLVVTSPGIVYKDLIILGSRVSETDGAAPGHVRAFNVISGEEEWIFHTIPQPGEYGYDTWQPEAWKKVGGANAWSGFALDEKRGIVFFSTGSCTPDFYGGDRKGQNLFANSIIAIEAGSGKRIWHYQLIHHDLWDYDLPAAPILVKIKKSNEWIDGVAQLTKTGNVFLFDRSNGDPIFGIEERKVPVSDIVGEESWPTQPVPSIPKAFVRQGYSLNDLPITSDSAKGMVLKRLETVRNEGIFTPSSERGSLIFPGFRGGAEWSGGAFDPESGLLYVNANEIPNISTLSRVYIDGDKSLRGENLYKVNCATCHGVDRKGLSPFPSLIDIKDRMNKSTIFKQIRDGKGQMPAFPNIKNVDVESIISFLFNEKKVVGKQENISMDQGSQVIKDSLGRSFVYAHSGYGQFLDTEGYPAVKPPWGTLTAINLFSGDIEWKIPLGQIDDLMKRGIPPTGTQNFGGAIVTRGGVLFIGASKDEMFRALDKKSGKLLWEFKLPAGGYATPTTYEVNGKQFIVIAAGGGGKNNTKKGDSYIAFTL